MIFGFWADVQKGQAHGIRYKYTLSDSRRGNPGNGFCCEEVLADRLDEAITDRRPDLWI